MSLRLASAALFVWSALCGVSFADDTKARSYFDLTDAPLKLSANCGDKNGKPTGILLSKLMEVDAGVDKSGDYYRFLPDRPSGAFCIVRPRVVYYPPPPYKPKSAIAYATLTFMRPARISVSCSDKDKHGDKYSPPSQHKFTVNNSIEFAFGHDYWGYFITHVVDGGPFSCVWRQP